MCNRHTQRHMQTDEWANTHSHSWRDKHSDEWVSYSVSFGLRSSLVQETISNPLLGFAKEIKDYWNRKDWQSAWTEETSWSQAYFAIKSPLSRTSRPQGKYWTWVSDGNSLAKLKLPVNKEIKAVDQECGVITNVIRSGQFKISTASQSIKSNKTGVKSTAKSNWTSCMKFYGQLERNCNRNISWPFHFLKQSKSICCTQRRISQLTM